jgi:2',3'-cyclic-nucleotide 2'-phosphodiesterase (5'-nucleotidase family)
MALEITRMEINFEKGWIRIQDDKNNEKLLDARTARRMVLKDVEAAVDKRGSVKKTLEKRIAAEEKVLERKLTDEEKAKGMLTVDAERAREVQESICAAAVKELKGIMDGLRKGELSVTALARRVWDAI